MAKTFQANDLRSLIRGVLNGNAAELNTTERDWSPGYVCQARGYTRHNGRRWRLALNGVSAHEPGSTTSWVEIIEPGSDSIRWRTGNTLTRVEATVGLETHVFRLKTGGSVGVNPASTSGPTHWEIEPRGFLVYNAALQAYYANGQLIMHALRLFQKSGPAPGIPPGSGWSEITTASTGGTGTGASTGGGGTTQSNAVSPVASITLELSANAPRTKVNCFWGVGPTGLPSTYRTEVRIGGELVATVTASDSYYGFTNLTPGATYTVDLRNIDTANPGFHSSSKTATITMDP